MVGRACGVPRKKRRGRQAGARAPRRAGKSGCSRACTTCGAFAKAGRMRGDCLAHALPRRAKVWGRVSTRARVHGMHLAMRTSIRIAEKCSAGSQLFPRARPQKSTYSWWALEQVGYADRGPHSRKVFTRVATFSSNPSTKVDIFVVAPREGWLCGPRSA